MMRRLLRGSDLVASTTIGVVLLVAGIVMLVLPGPGLLAAAAGLVILARHYAWAARLKQAVLRRINDVRRRAHALADRATPDDEEDPDMGRPAA